MHNSRVLISAWGILASTPPGSHACCSALLHAAHIVRITFIAGGGHTDQVRDRGQVCQVRPGLTGVLGSSLRTNDMIGCQAVVPPSAHLEFIIALF